MAFSGRHSRQDPALAGYFHPKHSSAGPTTGGPDIRGCADTVVVGGTAADAGGAEPHPSAQAWYLPGGPFKGPDCSGPWSTRATVEMASHDTELSGFLAHAVGCSNACAGNA